MKIAFITDTHFGVHSNSTQFLDHQEVFFNEIFFPYLEKNNIKTVFSLGDEFENRKVVNFYSLSRAKAMFFDRFEERNIELKIIVGNHSMFLKDSVDINSPKLLFDKYKNIEIIESPTKYEYDGIKFLSVPWITTDNKDLILKTISETNAEYLLGHFEVTDIKLRKEWQFYKGLEHNILNKFVRVLSGHFHMRTHKSNFSYIGTPYQSSWEDLYEEKGFEVFDTQTKEFEFIKNPKRIYNSIEYDDDIDIDGYDFDQFKDQYIRLFLTRVPNQYEKYDIFNKKLSQYSYNVSVIETYFDKTDVSDIDKMEENDDENNREESTLDTIHKKCLSVSEVIDSDKLFNYLQIKYKEAEQNLEA